MKTLDEHIYKILVALAIASIGLGTVFYHMVEKFTWVDAYYFSVITLATVGYGDLTPQTDLGKIFTTFYILGGVGIITAFITFSLKRRHAKHYDKQLQKHSESNAESAEDNTID